MSAIKRIHRDLNEWRESQRNFGTIFAEPIEDDMFIWHFNLVVENDEAKNVTAIHGEIIFPSDYPFSPPSVSFFGSVPHQQVSRSSGKMVSLCLDMLQGNNQGYYSGWSSAYSAVSVLAQVETLVDDFPDRAALHEWKRFRCSRCSHNGERPCSFYPEMHLRFSRSSTSSDSESESTVHWSLLNRDVEGVIFSFLSQYDYRMLVHVNTRIKRVLYNHRWYHWKTIECYHSHENFGSFMRLIRNAHHEQAGVAMELFGIGFSVDYFENGGRSRGRTELVLKDVYVVPDILRYRAFKEGVTFSMWRDTKFTSFLPLYLNNLHGYHAMALAEEVIREQYHVPSSEVFEPILMLKFLSKLMNTTVVSLMREVEDSQDENGDSVELFTSIKALQSYMYFYHLLLGFCRRYPRITSHARKKVFDFVAKVGCRDKKNYPDLGELLVYLSIVPNMAWSKFGPIFMEECFVRDAKWILQEYPELIVTDGSSDVSCIRLRRTWETSKVGKRLMMFQYYFLHNVCGVGEFDSDGSTGALNLSLKLDLYNRTLGQVDESVAVGLQRRCRVVFQVDDWMQFYAMVNLPCPSARALTHLLRVSMVESDRKGYQRFVELRTLREDDLVHRNADLCLCSGAVRSLCDRGDVKMDDGLETGMQVMTQRYLDVAFSVDCTGSMSSYLYSVKQYIKVIAMQLATEVENLNVRFAIVGYRDHGMEAGNWRPSVTKSYGFTPVDKFRSNLAQMSVGGGGGEEAVADAWYQVLGLNWRRVAVKAVIHIADIGGHGLKSDRDVCPDGHDPIVHAKQMLRAGITLYNVGCRMRGEIHENFYRATAFMTGGLYLTLENAVNLPAVIVESTREGMSLAAVVPKVYTLLKQLKDDQRHATKSQLAYIVWKELVAQGVTTKKVKCVATDEELSAQVYDASHSLDLAQCRQILNDKQKYRNCSMTGHTKSRGSGRSDGKLITLEQTLRCMTRAQNMGDCLEWMDKGCVYHMEKYNSTAARARYDEHGMEYSGKLIRIKKGNFNPSDMVQYHDCKTQKNFTASVVKVNESRYSVTVVIRELRNARREVPLTSRSLRKMDAVTTRMAKTVKPRCDSRRPASGARGREYGRRSRASEFAPRRNKHVQGRQRASRTSETSLPKKKHSVTPEVVRVRVQLGVSKKDGKGSALVGQIRDKTVVNFASMTCGRRLREDVKAEETKEEVRQVEQVPVEAVSVVTCTRSPSPSTPPPPLRVPVRSFSMSEADMSERSALCVMLPPSLWQDVQAIRREHDDSFQHWRIPVIKLLHPFVDRTRFEEHAENLGRGFGESGLRAFTVKLTGFGAVKSARVGGQKMVEVFLKTEIVRGDSGSWHMLLDALSVMYPNRVESGLERDFKARIVVGQIAKKNAQQVVRGWKAAFGQKEVTFRVSKVCLLSRCGFNAPFAAEHDVLF